MQVEKITSSAISELRAAALLVTTEFDGITAAFYFGHTGEKLTHIHTSGLRSSGWLIRGGHDMLELDELALEELKASPTLSAPDEHAGFIRLHHDWHGYERPAAHHETFVFIVAGSEHGPISGLVLHPEGYMGDGYSLHETARELSAA